MPYESPEEKRRRLMEAMAASIQSSGFTDYKTPSPDGGSLGKIAPLSDSGTYNPTPPQMRESQPIPYPNVPSEQQMQETSEQTRPYRVGYGAKGLTGIDRDMLKRKVMDEAPARSPIEDRGDTIGYGTVQKADPWWKRAGKSVLTGLAMADSDNPNQILGSAIGGGLTGASNQQNASLLKRKFDERVLDSEIDQGLKREQETQQLTNLRAVPEIARSRVEQDEKELQQKTQYDIDRLNIERDKAAGLINQQEAQRREREADRRERERHNRETESIGRARLDRPAADTTAKHEAAREEYDQLVNDERAAGEEKNRAYAVLESLKTAFRDKTNTNKPSLDDIDQATTAAEKADSLYQSFGAKKTAAKRRMTENQPSNGNRSGKSMSRANLEKFAKAEGRTIEEALTEAKARGITVY